MLGAGGIHSRRDALVRVVPKGDIRRCSKLTPVSAAIWVFGQLLAPPGRRTVNTDPFPGSLVTVTSPPIMRASLRVIARPRPVPPKFCAAEARLA